MLNYLDELDKKVNEIFIPSEMVWNQQLIEKIELQNNQFWFFCTWSAGFEPRSKTGMG